MALRLLLTAAGVVAVLYLMLAAGMYSFQRRFLFHPDPRRVVPAEVGLADVSEVTLSTPDGETLVAWYGPAQPGGKTILYFHGNAGNLAERRDRIEAYRRFGFGLLMLGYRGSSGSTGTPSERAHLADAKLAYDWLRAKDTPAASIVLYGESLGTGVAVRTAAENPVGGLILDAPYTAVVDVAAANFWFLPVRLLLTDQFKSLEYISQVRAPVMVIHGARDTIIPVDMGRRMFAAANDPKVMVEYPEAGHIYHSQFGSLEQVRSFINGLSSP